MKLFEVIFMFLFVDTVQLQKAPNKKNPTLIWEMFEGLDSEVRFALVYWSIKMTFKLLGGFFIFFPWK